MRTVAIILSGGVAILGLMSQAHANLSYETGPGSPIGATNTSISIDEGTNRQRILTFRVTPGTVGYRDLNPDGTPGPISDELKFAPDPNNAAQSIVTFFSDLEQTIPDNTFDKTDTENLPNAAGAEVNIINASNAAGNLIRYTVTSDTAAENDVPEPGSLALLGGALLGLGFLGRKRASA